MKIYNKLHSFKTDEEMSAFLDSLNKKSNFIRVAIMEKIERDNIMKKILLLITALALIACGSLKKDKTSTEIDTKSDLNASKIDFKRFTDSSFVLRPFDTSKPMLIGKDTIYNVMIEQHYKDRVHIVKDTIHKLDTQVIELKDKNVQRDNTTLFLGIAGIIALFLFLVVLIIIKKLTI